MLLQRTGFFVGKPPQNDMLFSVILNVEKNPVIAPLPPQSVEAITNVPYFLPAKYLDATNKELDSSSASLLRMTEKKKQNTAGFSGSCSLTFHISFCTSCS
jgi:hypothetical protein